MKKSIKLSLLMLVCASVTVFDACKKPEKGDTGPAGADGNANVHSQISTVTSWSFSAPVYYADITVPALTEAIANNGAVLVYMASSGGGSPYMQLPVTVYPSASYSETFSVITATGVVEINIKDSDLTSPSLPSAHTFKIVTIESRMLQAHPEVNLKDYEQVKRVFNLK